MAISRGGTTFQLRFCKPKWKIVDAAKLAKPMISAVKRREFLSLELPLPARIFGSYISGCLPMREWLAGRFWGLESLWGMMNGGGVGCSKSRVGL